VKRRKLLLGSAALFGAGGFVTGTNAFSTAEVERGVYIDVVEDGDALLQLKYPPQNIDCAGDVQLVEIGNLTGSKLTSITVTVDSVSGDISVDEPGAVVGENADESTLAEQGESISVDTSVEAAEGFTGIASVAFHVTAAGDDISIETTEPRTVDIDAHCEGEDDELEAGDVNFQQEGNSVTFEFALTETVVVWYESGGDIKSEEIELDDDNRITPGGLDDVGGNDTIIAIEAQNALFISSFWLEEQTDSGFDGACKVDSVEDVEELLSDEEELIDVCD